MQVITGEYKIWIICCLCFDARVALGSFNNYVMPGRVGGVLAIVTSIVDPFV